LLLQSTWGEGSRIKRIFLKTANEKYSSIHPLPQAGKKKGSKEGIFFTANLHLWNEPLGKKSKQVDAGSEGIVGPEEGVRLITLT